MGAKIYIQWLKPSEEWCAKETTISVKQDGNKDYIYRAFYVYVEHLWIDTKGILVTF